MGKLGKKARKFAKKNLQSVLKRKRKINSMINKKHSSRGKGDPTKDQSTDATVLSSGSNCEDLVLGDTSLDLVFSDDDSDSAEESSDSDGFLSEDPSCVYTTESESENDSGEKGVTLLGQNNGIHEELAKKKRKLDQMREKDPNFAIFLETENLKQVETNENYSDGEDEIDDQDMEDVKHSGSDFMKDKFLTVSAVESWKKQIMEKQDFSSLPNLLNAYRIACHYGSENSFDSSLDQNIKNSGVLSEVIMIMLQEGDAIFRKLLGVGSSNWKVESVLALKNNAKWKTLKPLVKSYLRSTLFLLHQVTEGDILVFSLTQIRSSVVLFAAFPSLLRRLIKAAVHFWATGGGAVSSSAFLTVQSIGLLINSSCYEICLMKAYNAFVAHCNIVECGNLKHLEFLVESLVDLYSLDVSKSFSKAQASIQQLARILQQGVKTKGKEVLRKIYTWQYINCVDLWVKFISANIKDSDLQPLLYTIIQVINGVVHLFHGPRYLPLRLKCLQMLNQLSSSSGIFIPITSFVLDSLDCIGNSKPAERHGTNINVSGVLKVPKQWLKLKYFQEELVLSVIELLSMHFHQWSSHISFPDLAIFPLIRLRKFHEKLTSESLRRPVKRLIDQVQQNVEFVQKKRDEAMFSPKDLDSVESFLQVKTCGSNLPFIQYYQSVARKPHPRSMLKKSSSPHGNVLGKEQQEFPEKMTNVVDTEKGSNKKRKKQKI